MKIEGYSKLKMYLISGLRIHDSETLKTKNVQFAIDPYVQEEKTKNQTPWLQPSVEKEGQNSLQKIETQQVLYDVLAFQHQLSTLGHVT